MRMKFYFLSLLGMLFFIGCKDCPECPPPTSTHEDHISDDKMPAKTKMAPHKYDVYLNKADDVKIIAGTSVYEVMIKNKKYYSLTEINNKKEFEYIIKNVKIKPKQKGNPDTIKGEFIIPLLKSRKSSDKGIVAFGTIGDKGCYTVLSTPVFVSLKRDGENEYHNYFEVFMDRHNGWSYLEYCIVTENEQDIINVLYSNNISFGIGTNYDPEYDVLFSDAIRRDINHDIFIDSVE